MIRRLFVYDNTNTVRAIKRLFVYDVGNTPRLVFGGATDTITFQVGNVGNQYGYSQGNYGIIISGAFTGGKTLMGIFDNTGTGQLKLQVSGFGSDPGATSLTTITVNGFTFPESTASYTYGAGIATWTWTGSAQMNLQVGNNVSLVATHSF